MEQYLYQYNSENIKSLIYLYKYYLFQSEWPKESRSKPQQMAVIDHLSTILAHNDQFNRESIG